jgi:hypothetical protein
MTQKEAELPRALAVAGAIGSILGGLLPAGIAVAGVWSYAERGYLRSRTGEAIETGWPTWAGFAWYGILLFGGLLLIRWGVTLYRRHVIGQ